MSGRKRKRSDDDDAKTQKMWEEMMDSGEYMDDLAGRKRVHRPRPRKFHPDMHKVSRDSVDSPTPMDVSGGKVRRKRCVGCGRFPSRRKGKGDSVALNIPKAPEKFKGFHHAFSRKRKDASWDVKDNCADPNARMGKGSQRQYCS